MGWGKKLVKIQSVKSQAWVADECIVAESFLDRLRGLIGTRSLRQGKGMLLSPCNDIHMWFMSIPIDVAFIRRMPREAGETGEKRRVVVSSVRKNVRPWKLLPLRDGKATETLELPIGTIERCNIEAGDELCIS